MAITKRDIDAIYVALRPRLLGLSTATVAAAPTVIAPHTHSSDVITHTGIGGIAAVDVEEAIEELDSEKLARDGSQTMLGDLPMNSNAIGGIKNITITGTASNGQINGVVDLHIVGTAPNGQIDGVIDLTFSGGVGDGVIASARIITMAGDDDDGEARIQNVERIIFNNEVTKSLIQLCSVIEFNIAVTPGTDHTLGEGKAGWSDLERGFMVEMVSGAAVLAVALGWGVVMCVAV